MKKEKEQSSSEEQKAANENLLIRLNQNYGKLSKGQKRLADFITAHYDQAVSMTAARLGQQVGVSESTTVRFAMQLGYAGYPEFQRALEEMVMNRLNSVQRMQFTYGRVPQGEILETVLQSDIEKIKMTLEEVDRSAFERAADTILSARTIYIVGIRSCAPLASFLAFYLHMIFPDVRQVQTNSSSEIFEQMIRITEDDVVIGANAVVLEGVRIGKGAVVAAGAVVTEDVAPNMVVAGTPARVIKQKDEKTLGKTELVAALRELK